MREPHTEEYCLGAEKQLGGRQYLELSRWQTHPFTTRTPSQRQMSLPSGPLDPSICVALQSLAYKQLSGPLTKRTEKHWVIFYLFLFHLVFIKKCLRRHWEEEAQNISYNSFLWGKLVQRSSFLYILFGSSDCVLPG